jgi:hypothetical protein
MLAASGGSRIYHGARPLTESVLRSPHVRRAGLAAQPKVSTAGLSAAPPARESRIVPWGRRLEKRTALSGPQSAPQAPRGPLPAVFRTLPAARARDGIKLLVQTAARDAARRTRRSRPLETARALRKSPTHALNS